MKQKMKEQLKATGTVRIVKTNASGTAVQEFEVPNQVVNTGKAFIAASMNKSTTNSPAKMSHMGIGTGSTGVAAENQVLGAQTYRSGVTAEVSGNTITYSATFAAGFGDGAIVEAGIFNADTGGTMLCRTTFPVVTKAAGDTISITWLVTVS
jgi:hypothetical protein